MFQKSESLANFSLEFHLHFSIFQRLEMMWIVKYADGKALQSSLNGTLSKMDIPER